MDTPTMTKETWVNIPSMPGFQISDFRRVRRSAEGDLSRNGCRWRNSVDGWFYYTIAPKGRRGYPGFTASFGGKTRLFYLHHIVAEIHHGPRPEACVVRHLDDDPTNLAPTNLAYGSQSDNLADARRNGNGHDGEKNPSSKLRRVDVCEIKELLIAGCAVRTIAKRYAVSDATIQRIKKGESWAD